MGSEPKLRRSVSSLRNRNSDFPVALRRKTDSQTKRKSRKRLTGEFIRQTSTEIFSALRDDKETTLEKPKRNNSRAYHSDNEASKKEELNEIHVNYPAGSNLPPSSTSAPTIRERDSTKPVRRLRRTISGKFRSNTLSHKVERVPPVDTSIHKSISQSSITVRSFSKMLKRAAHIDQTDSKGQSLLHLCIARGHLDFAKALLKKGANINLQDSMGYTALHCAAIERNLEGCLLLLESKNIDVTIFTKEKSNILHYLVRIPAGESNLVIYRKVLHLLIEKGIDVNRPNKHKEAPIHLACMKDNVQAVAFLLEHGADCNLKTALSETPLHTAIRAGSLKLVRILMESGADPTALSDGETPVDVAEQYQHTDILECLQSIIEEEIICELTAAIQSPRIQLNESTIIKQGHLEVFCENDWKTLFVQLNKQRIIGKPEEGDSNQIFNLFLNHSTISPEDGTIISEHDEQLWCFSVTQIPDTFVSFATKLPEEREEWIEEIQRVIKERQDLLNVYEKLKAQSKPRKRLRQQERNIAFENCRLGLKKLMEINSPVQMSEFLVNEPDTAAASLWTLLTTENESLFIPLTKYLLDRDLFECFVKCAITHEIRVSSVGETLFREMSLCTRLLSCYLDLEAGKEYLRSTVLELLNDISSSNTTVQDNIDNIATIAQQFLNQILSTPNACPYVFRELLRHTRERVDKVFPNMTHAVVGGFVFLRFICPAIISPHKFGLTSKTLL